MRRSLAALGGTLTLLALTSTARADEVLHPVSLALLGGYGVNDSNAFGGDALNLYGPGVGARAGYTFPFGLYAGASFAWHAGFSRDADATLGAASGRVMPAGLEAGYDIRLDRLVVRPYLGAGLAFYKSSFVADATHFSEGSGHKAALWPGVAATYDATDRFFAGVDLRYTIVPLGNDTAIVSAGGGDANALGGYATLGVRI